MKDKPGKQNTHFVRIFKDNIHKSVQEFNIPFF